MIKKQSHIWTTFSPRRLSVASSTRCIPTGSCFTSAAAAPVGSSSSSSSSWPSPSPTPWIPPASLCCWTSCTPPAFPWPWAWCQGCSALPPTCRWTMWLIRAGSSCSCTGKDLPTVMMTVHIYATEWWNLAVMHVFKPELLLFYFS